jgi:secretion/DNA translocation related TadE-like protein
LSTAERTGPLLRPRYPGRGPVPWRRQEGSVSVLSAAVLFLVGILSLATVDVMRAVQGVARAQMAADAAALAAAQEIAIPSGAAPEAMAADYAERNGARLVSCRCEDGSGEAVVEVEVPISLVFVGADRSVRATARAVIEGAASLRTHRTSG